MLSWPGPLVALFLAVVCSAPPAVPTVVTFSVALSLALGLGAGAVAAWRLVRTSPMALWGRG